MNEDEILFLRIANDPVFRSVLLERLEKLGLLAAFLSVESETTPTGEDPARK